MNLKDVTIFICKKTNFENNNNTIHTHTHQTTQKPALESQQSILLRENNNNKNKSPQNSH